MVHQEGPGGVENSFGHNILPIVLGIASDASTKVNDSIAAGTFTIMLDMEKLGTAATYNPLTTQLFAGGATSAPPDFSGNGMTNWPVVPTLLTDGMTIAGGSKIQFPMSYLANNTWVSGSKGTVTLSLTILRLLARPGHPERGHLDEPQRGPHAGHGRHHLGRAPDGGPHPANPGGRRRVRPIALLGADHPEHPLADRAGVRHHAGRDPGPEQAV